MITGEDSYIERMRDRLDPKQQVDLFICQLSTNDATRNSPLGEISESRDLESFDVETVCGAIEYIIAYAKETWHCPVMFYTNPKYDSEYVREDGGGTSENSGKMADRCN